MERQPKWSDTLRYILPVTALAVAAILGWLAGQVRREELAGVGNAAPQVATSGELAATSTARFPKGVWRVDYDKNVGAPPIFFMPLLGDCTANRLVSDGGLCIDTTTGDGNSWRAQHPASGADVRQWGARNLGDASAPLNAAAVATASLGIPLRIPGGTFNVCKTSFVVPNGAFIAGSGPLSKIQTWPECKEGEALKQTVLLPDNSPIENPIATRGRIQGLTIDGHGMSQWVLNGRLASIWSFSDLVIRNARPTKVITAKAGATAAGTATLRLSEVTSLTIGSLLDDLDRPGVIPPGTTVASCSPSCLSAKSVTLSVNVAAYDDGTGIGSGDRIRFMTPTANVYLQGGYALDFSQNVNIENVNDPNNHVYKSQTTLPMAGIYITSASDSNFTGVIIKNAMYCVIDTNAYGNVFGPNTHCWGQGRNNPLGHAYDLRVQYGYAVGSGNRFIGTTVDDPVIAGYYVGMVRGQVGARLTDNAIQWIGMPPAYAFGVLLGSDLEQAKIVGTNAFGQLFAGVPQQVVYQRGRSHASTIVGDNNGALYTTIGRTLEGGALSISGNQTTYLGPVGASQSGGSFWVLPNDCSLTGLYVKSTSTAGSGNWYSFTVHRSGDTPISGIISGVATLAVGSPSPPANTSLFDVRGSRGDTVTIKLVASEKAPTNNFSYRVYTNCN